MNKSTLLILPLLCLTFRLLYPMEKNREFCSKPLICFEKPYVVYIGMGKTKTELEKIYGKKFPLNTAFFRAHFKNADECNKPKKMLPDFVPYEDIMDRKEDEYLKLELFGKSYLFLCKQRASEDYPQSSFQDMVKSWYTHFWNHANYLVEDESEESLVQAEVIEMGRYATNHGKNSIKNNQTFN